MVQALEKALGASVKAFIQIPASPGSERCGTLELDDGRRLHLTVVSWRSPDYRSLRWESQIASLVAAVGPRLVAEVRSQQMRLLVHEHVPGRAVDLSYGSQDLPLVGAWLRRAAQEPVAEPVDGIGDAAGWFGPARFSGWSTLSDLPPGYVADSEGQLMHRLVALQEQAHGVLRGGHLVHGGLHPGNLLRDGDRIAAVGWHRSRFGPPWLDTALMIPRLIAAGHHPDDAERWGREHGALDDASDSDITAVAVAVAGQAVHRDIYSFERTPRASELPASAALAWMRSRLHTAAECRHLPGRTTGGGAW
ncbi:hypothetical protein GCM10009760_16560 [Kitasatospora kazusensis]|uniref:Aminoglycoside phosphotransferase domain-containing protein n=1 Tax=Kitasatospora kazusensis TaxID=407974 RepID=A0ABN2Z4Q5_9ACTN